MDDQVGLAAALHAGADAICDWPLLRGVVERQARRAFVTNRGRNLFYGVHETWDEAATSARTFGTEGYDNAASASLYDFRTRMDQHDYPSLYWIHRSMHEGMRTVFDVGGAIGIKFLAFREHLSRWPEMVWTVHDVPAMVTHGREQAAQRGDSQRLRFAERFADGDGTDILFASGVLQYLPQTIGEMLKSYTRLPRRIVINTAAIHPEREFFTVNSLGTAFCPYRIQTQATLVRGLTSLGYRLRESWTNPDKPMTIPRRPEFSLKHYSGFCLDLMG